MSTFTLSGFGDEIAPELETQLSVMALNKIHCIELRSVGGKGIAEHTPAEAKEIKKQLDAVGFRVSSIGSPIGKIGIQDNFEKHLELFRNTLEIACIMEAPYIRIFSFYIPEGEKPASCRDEVMSRMSRLCDEAKDWPVRLLHENELGIYGDTPERCADLINTLGFDRLGAIFDPANFVNYREVVEVYPYAWHLLKKYVQYMHIKDAVHTEETAKGVHTITPAGGGEGHIADILRELKDEGYEGYLSVEPHLGNFSGFAKLERHTVEKDMPESGPQSFAKAAAALQELLKTI